MVQPIKPSEVVAKKTKDFPDGVLEAFNALIAKNFSGRQSLIKFKEAAKVVAEKMNCTTSHVYEQKWLDVEDIYRANGWKVTVDQPAYCESYDGYFIFEEKK